MILQTKQPQSQFPPPTTKFKNTRNPKNSILPVFSFPAMEQKANLLRNVKVCIFMVKVEFCQQPRKGIQKPQKTQELNSFVRVAGMMMMVVGLPGTQRIFFFFLVLFCWVLWVRRVGWAGKMVGFFCYKQQGENNANFDTGMMPWESFDWPRK